ncbi:hypothetical protein SCHPADRAFT_897253, partial [Schizopora paradoxa]
RPNPTRKLPSLDALGTSTQSFREGPSLLQASLSKDTSSETSVVKDTANGNQDSTSKSLPARNRITSRSPSNPVSQSSCPMSDKRLVTSSASETNTSSDDGTCNEFFFPLLLLPLRALQNVCAHILLLDPQDVSSMRLTCRANYLEITRVPFILAGVASSWSTLESEDSSESLWSSRGRTAMQRSEVQPSVFRFSSYESLDLLAAWRKCSFFKPMKCISFIFPISFTATTAKEEKEMRSDALRKIREFFVSLPDLKGKGDFFIGAVELNLGTVLSLCEIDTVELRDTLEYASRTGCRTMALTSRSGFGIPYNTFNPVPTRRGLMTNPSLRTFRVAGGVFFSADVMPWIYANISPGSLVTDIKFRNTMLLPADLSRFARCIHLKNMKTFEVDDIGLGDLIAILQKHPTVIQQIDTRRTRLGSGESITDMNLSEEAHLKALLTLRGSGREIARLLPFIKIQNDPAHLTKVELLLTENEDFVFNVGDTLYAINLIASNKIIIMNLFLEILPTDDTFTAFFGVPNHERPEGCLAVQSVCLCMDFQRNCQLDFAVAFDGPHAVSVRQIKVWSETGNRKAVGRKHTKYRFLLSIHFSFAIATSKATVILQSMADSSSGDQNNFSDALSKVVETAVRSGLEPFAKQFEEMHNAIRISSSDAENSESVQEKSGKKKGKRAANRRKAQANTSTARRMGTSLRKTGERNDPLKAVKTKLNEFLREQKVLFDARLETDQAVYVTAEQLRLFEEEGDTAGPKLSVDGSGMPLDWTQNFASSLWNKEAFQVLALEFRKRLKNDKLYKKGRTTHDWIISQMKERLKRVNSSVIKDAASREAFFLARKEKQGRSDRRRGVGADFMSGDVESLSKEDIKKWKDARTVLKELTANGGSDDETDADESETCGQKVFRRLEQPFLNKKVTELLRVIDTYRYFESDLVAKDQRGTPARRITDALKDDPRPPMEKLPINFYDEGWLKRQTEHTRDRLTTKEAVEIPSIVRHIRK